MVDFTNTSCSNYMSFKHTRINTTVLKNLLDAASENKREFCCQPISLSFCWHLRFWPITLRTTVYSQEILCSCTSHLLECASKFFTLLYKIDVKCLQNISLQFSRGDLWFIVFSRKYKLLTFAFTEGLIMSTEFTSQNGFWTILWRFFTL